MIIKALHPKQIVPKGLPGSRSFTRAVGLLLLKPNLAGAFALGVYSVEVTGQLSDYQLADWTSQFAEWTDKSRTRG